MGYLMENVKQTPSGSAENKMGVMAINPLLLTMALPMIASMLVQALYNIVDSMFVAQLSENALTAVSLAFPVQNLMIAVATGTGVGINAFLSRSLGEKNFDKANKVANNGLFLAFLSYLLFALFALFFSNLFFSTQTDNQEIIKYGNDYIRVCCFFSFGVFFQITQERLLQSTGKTFYTMITQGTGAIINIILDPIMIFGLFGFPRLEVTGAALATVIGQIIAAILAFYFNRTRNHEIHITLRKFKPEAKIIGGIYSVGIPSIIMVSIGSIMIFGLNKILITFTPTAVAVLGIYFKLQSFIFMPVFGLNNGMVPIVAYNFGARKPERIIQTIKLSIVYAVCMMAAGLIIFQFLPATLLHIFNASDNMLNIGIPALRIISLSFLFAGFGIVTSSVFQALGHGILSLEVSVIRQLLVILPAAYLLSKAIGVTGVWWSIPTAEIVSVTFCALFLKRVFVKEIHPLRSTQQTAPTIK